jgi:AraC-like DNA-binding protein
MQYQEHAPHPVLTPYVKCYWSLALAVPEDVTGRQQFLAEGVEVSFNHGGTVSIASGDRPPRTAHVACLSGPMTRPMRLQHTGALDLLGVCFRAGGAYPFFSCPASELVDAFAAVDDLLGSAGLRLADRVHNGTAEERVAALDEFFLARLARARRDDARVRKALGLIESRGGGISVDQLSRLTGLSSRQLERRFRESVGILPKQLCRSLRFKNVFKLLARNPAERWASIALACGYYDQSHMINDFKRFTGVSPAAFFERPPGLDNFFVGNF